MSVDEASRHRLYTELESMLGPEPTSTLMSLLPPVGWADVATKQDVAHATEVLGEQLRREMADLRTEFAGLRIEFASFRTDVANAQRQQTVLLIGAMLSISVLTTLGGALL